MIRKYEHKDFKHLNSWITDAEMLLLFSGPEWSFPLTEAQIAMHQQKYPCKQLYVGINDQHIPYAVGELIWNEPDSPRLGRLLIGDSSQRGKGLGTAFVRELMDECIATLAPESICLFVFEENLPAIRCYEKLGFKFEEARSKTVTLNGKDYNMLKMVCDCRSEAAL